MLLAFKHKSAGDSLNAQVIAAWEGFNYTHVELIFRDYGLCFSSRPATGVSFLPISQAIQRPEFWHVVDLGRMGKAESYLTAQRFTGQPFAWGKVVLNVGLGLDTQTDGYFCSEVIYRVLVQNPYLGLPVVNPLTVTPRKLYNFVQSV